MIVAERWPVAWLVMLVVIEQARRAYAEERAYMSDLDTDEPWICVGGEAGGA